MRWQDLHAAALADPMLHASAGRHVKRRDASKRRKIRSDRMNLSARFQTNW
jgi:hypothetical protein